MSYDSNSDAIDILPTDQNIPTHSEIQIVDQLFKQNHTTIQKILIGLKDIIIVGILFLCFITPQFDDVLKRFVPSTESSPYILMFIKTLLFSFAYFLVKNIYLVRK